MKFAKVLIGLLVLLAGAVLTLKYYSIIFSHTYTGEVVGIERIELPMAVMTRSDADISAKIFSFAVAIKDVKTGEIHTASAEDRQWAVVQKGQCAESVFLPYPPWNFEKRGTFFGARLIRLFDCPK